MKKSESASNETDSLSHNSHKNSDKIPCEKIESSSSVERTSFKMSIRHTVYVFPIALVLYLYKSSSTSSSLAPKSFIQPIVNVSNGQIKGKITHGTRDHNFYYEFLGIPYAKPPLNELRFEAPQEHENWSKLKLTTEYGSKCPQIEFFSGRQMGTEDCLYLNIFTPKLPGEDALDEEQSTETSKKADSLTENVPNNNLFPVMVFIHGGYFMTGGANPYNPQYFMAKGLNTVVVTINYRVGALGFLNSGDGLVRGNMGLKDQVASLKWIQKNIHVFNGDRKKVTIFGSSAGASAVHYHTLSPMSKGLFHKAISQSGTAIKPWSFMSTPKEQILQLGKSLNCPLNDSITLVNCLKNVDAKALIATQSNYLEVFLDPLAIYAPSVESIVDENTFLAKNPYEILVKGEQNDVPWISGLNSEEGLLVSARMSHNEKVIDKINKDWETYAPKLLAYSDHSQKNKISKEVQKFYIGDKVDFKTQINNFTNMLSDRLYFTATSTAAQIQAKKSPVYLYYFNYPTKYSSSTLLSSSGSNNPAIDFALNIASKWVRSNIFGRNNTSLGVCHSDELFMLFEMGYMVRTDKGDTDFEMSQNLVRLWTDFARSDYGEPLKFQDVIWEPIKPLNSPLQYLNINKDAKIIKEPFSERVAFWINLGLL